jgi:predicted glutamine amidotransferase
MCRLLLIKFEHEFEISPYLKTFANIAQNNREYQGHGWGCAYLVNGEWKIYKNLKPIWEDDFDQFPSTTQLLAHARSAFRDQGIRIENNMPFCDEKYVFIFNGELHGVKIKADGRIGAEKIFNFIKRFDRGNFYEAIKKSVKIIKRRSRYIRAMNFIISDKRNVYLTSMFNDRPDYFTMTVKKSNGDIIICSEKFPGEVGWCKIENNTIGMFE